MSRENFYYDACEKNIEKLFHDPNLNGIKIVIHGCKTGETETFFFSKDEFIDECEIHNIGIEIELSPERYASLRWVHSEKEYIVETYMFYKDNYSVEEKVKLKYVELFPYPNYPNYFAIELYGKDMKILSNTTCKRNDCSSLMKNDNTKGLFSSIAECFYENI